MATEEWGWGVRFEDGEKKGKLVFSENRVQVLSSVASLFNFIHR